MVETAHVELYPALIRAIETSHRNAQEGLRRRARLEVDTDHQECYLITEVMNASDEDLHLKTCFLLDQTSASGPPSSIRSPPPSTRSLPSEMALLHDDMAPTTMIVGPRANRRLVIPLPRLETSSPLLQPPPPPPPPPGGGKAPKPIITLDAPEWTRALYGLCRSLRFQWSDQHGLRAGLLRLPPTLTTSIRPAAMERIKRPPMRLVCYSSSEPPAPPYSPATPCEDLALTSPASSPSCPSLMLLHPLVFRSATSPSRNKPGERGGSARQAGPQRHPPYTFVPVHFRIENRSEAPLPPSHCFCHAYQDYGKGNLSFDIDSGRAMWSGSLSWTTPTVAPGASFEHVAWVSFTAPGHYGVGFSTSRSEDYAATSTATVAAAPVRAPVLDKKMSSGLGMRMEPVPVIYWGHEVLEIIIEGPPVLEPEAPGEGKKAGVGVPILQVPPEGGP